MRRIASPKRVRELARSGPRVQHEVEVVEGHPAERVVAQMDEVDLDDAEPAEVLEVVVELGMDRDPIGRVEVAPVDPAVDRNPSRARARMRACSARSASARRRAWWRVRTTPRCGRRIPCSIWICGSTVSRSTLRGALDRREQLAVHDQRDHEPLAALPRPLDPVLVDLHVGRVVERRPAAEPQLLSVGGLGHRPTRGRQRAVARESPVEDGADRAGTGRRG